MMKKLLSLLVVLVLGATFPAYALELKRGETHIFTLTAGIPADPSLASQRLTVDFVGDGLGFIVNKSTAATDPLGNYPWTDTFSYTVPDSISIGDHALNATLTLVDEAGNVSEPATSSLVVQIVPLIPVDNIAPDQPTGFHFVEPVEAP